MSPALADASRHSRHSRHPSPLHQVSATARPLSACWQRRCVRRRRRRAGLTCCSRRVPSSRGSRWARRRPRLSWRRRALLQVRTIREVGREGGHRPRSIGVAGQQTEEVSCRAAQCARGSLGAGMEHVDGCGTEEPLLLSWTHAPRLGWATASVEQASRVAWVEAVGSTRVQTVCRSALELGL